MSWFRDPFCERGKTPVTQFPSFVMAGTSPGKTREERGTRNFAPLTLFLLLPLLALAACGFHPLYAERQQAAYEPSLASVKVAPIKDRIGQMLELSLRDSFNPSDAPVETRYVLAVILNVSRADLGIQRDATATRGDATIIASFTLTDAKTNKVILTGSSQSTSLFNIVDNGYATEVAAQDAQTRTMRDISDDIRTRVALFLRRQTAG